MESENNKSKKIKLIVLIIAILLIIGIFVISFLGKMVNSNPSDALGNTCLNILNGGDFCEYENKIYFSNPADNGRLYVMDLDCNNIKNLNKDTAHNINVYGSRIYYTRKTKNFVGRYVTGIARCTLNGHHNESLSPDIVSSMFLYGNDLYCLGSEDKKTNNAYKINILSKKKASIYEAAANPSCIYDNKIYYANPEDNFYIHCYNIKDKNDKQLLKFRAYNVSVSDNTLYYIDISDNYSLKSFNLITGNSITLFKGSKDLRCYNYNILDNIVYYAETDSSGSAVYKITTEGNDKTLILTDNIGGIYTTSKYIFITVYNSDKIYKFPAKGELVVSTLKVQ